MSRCLTSLIPTPWGTPAPSFCIPTAPWRAATIRVPTAARQGFDKSQLIANRTRHHYAALRDNVQRMTAPIRIVLAAFLTIAITGFAQAHPHVWVTMKTDLVYAPDGRVTGVRHHWAFDDMFSAFATQGLESKEKGKFTR